MDIPNFAEKYHKILEHAEPYVLAFPGNMKHMDLCPWGIQIEEGNQYSCIELKNSRFYDLLHSLDGLAFGPKGMPMDKWVFYDCGEMPGGVCGFGVRADKLDDSALKEFKIDKDYKGLIPISMYIAIPMMSGEWFGHNLSSANRVLETPLPGLGLFTKAFALKVFQIQIMLGATQWDSSALHIHLQLADMELLSSYTPAHSFNNTMTYKSIYMEEDLIRALNGTPRKAQSWDYLHPAEDEEFSRKIQERIENGERFKIVGRPQVEDGKTVYPVEQII